MVWYYELPVETSVCNFCKVNNPAHLIFHTNKLSYFLSLRLVIK